MHDHFWGKWALDDKNEYNLFYGKLGNEYCYEIFSSKKFKPTEWKPNNRFWVHIFHRISSFVGPIISKNNDRGDESIGLKNHRGWVEGGGSHVPSIFRGRLCQTPGIWRKPEKSKNRVSVYGYLPRSQFRSTKPFSFFFVCVSCGLIPIQENTCRNLQNWNTIPNAAFVTE